ncbi:MAG: ComF family protein [Flavobacteriales bacterium]|nr:ComF family protein [Flavobacteriales bacterium]
MAVKSILHDIFTAVLPRRCSSCGTPLAARERFWCIPCGFHWSRHVQTAHQRFQGRLNWAHAWSWLKLQGAEERSLVHALKYGGNPQLGVALGMAMAEEWMIRSSHAQRTYRHWSLVPVPLHPQRQRKRGYNQGMQLAIGWSQRTGMSIAPLCIRTDAGRSFTGYNRRQRMARRNNPFTWKETAPPLAPETQGLFLIDDVVTTGSTLESMNEALRKNWTGPMAFVTLADAAR